AAAGCVLAMPAMAKSSPGFDGPLTVHLRSDSITLRMAKAPQLYLAGTIDAAAVEQVRQLLQSGKVPPGTDIYLDSSAGDAAAGMALGKLFRAARFSTHLGTWRTGAGRSARLHHRYGRAPGAGRPGQRPGRERHRLVEHGKTAARAGGEQRPPAAGGVLPEDARRRPHPGALADRARPRKPGHPAMRARRGHPGRPLHRGRRTRPEPGRARDVRLLRDRRAGLATAAGQAPAGRRRRAGVRAPDAVRATREHAARRLTGRLDRDHRQPGAAWLLARTVSGRKTHATLPDGLPGAAAGLRAAEGTSGAGQAVAVEAPRGQAAARLRRSAIGGKITQGASASHHTSAQAASCAAP